jgi:prepilin-type N-terminal cleavage/methylation domain-containing protein
MVEFRRGMTIVELLVVMAILGAMAAIAVPRAVTTMDRFSVRGATQDVVLAIAAARAAASDRSAYVSFVADPRTGRVRAVSGGETLLERDLARTRGIRLEASRESVTFAPGGLGWGAANTTVIVTKGTRSDTIVMSRLGRVRTAW